MSDQHPAGGSPPSGTNEWRVWLNFVFGDVVKREMTDPEARAAIVEAWDKLEPARLSPDAGTGQQTLELRDALEDMVYQFGYPCVKAGQPAIFTGGLSALEDAFEALGWDEPYVIPDPVWCDAPVEPRCPNRTTCGTPTPDGYKHFCHEHFHLWKEAADAAGKTLLSGEAPTPTEPHQ